MNSQIALLFLAGGTGTRMGGSLAKQFLSIEGKPLALYSLETFIQMGIFQEIIIVSPQEGKDFLKNASHSLKFATPGERRQDSLWNGLKLVSSTINWICVHDAARPVIDEAKVSSLIKEGLEHGAATLGLPAKYTMKECDNEGNVLRTLPRAALWEIQTPQIIRKDILEKGFAIAQKEKLTVTDDVSLAELAGFPVKVVMGWDTNIKVTTPKDLGLVEKLLSDARKAL